MKPPKYKYEIQTEDACGSCKYLNETREEDAVATVSDILSYEDETTIIVRKRKNT